MNEKEQLILKTLRDAITTNQLASISFIELSKIISIPKQDLDAALNLLERERYIDQYVIEKHDNFNIRITDKGRYIGLNIEE